MIAAWITTATAALGVGGGLSYGAMAPQCQWFGRTFARGRAGSRQIALTYDDGPNDRQTLELLEVLDKHQVKATFFMVGRFVRLYPRIAETVAQAGHAIGNHTWSHPNLIFCSAAEIRRQLDECDKALHDAVGTSARLFRPPFGARRPQVLQVAQQMGLTSVLWSITGYDWKPKPAEAIAGHVLGRVRGGDVILLHDGGHLAPGADRSHTVRATGQIIARCRDMGYSFTTIPEMIAAS